MSEIDQRQTEQKPTQEFAIITKAKDLVKHTFMMTSERRFPKKYRFTIVNRLHDLTLDIFQHIQEANELDLTDPQEYRERRYEQKKALTECKTALFLIELSFEKELISSEQCAEWTRHVMNVKNMTAKWRKQDRERFAALQQNNWRNHAAAVTPGVFLGVRLVASNSYNVRNVNSSGAMNWNNAYNGNNGVRPLWWKPRLSRPKG